MTLDPDALERCLATLDAALRLGPSDPAAKQVQARVAAFAKDEKKRRRRERRLVATREDRAVLDSCKGVRVTAPALEPPSRELHRERTCIVCNCRFKVAHDHYPQHCARCGDVDRDKRDARADLTGRRALVTGGRIKIGFELAKKLLRDGAHVTITTRFPRDAEARFRQEPDADTWFDRLEIAPIDLTDPAALLAFIGDKRAAWPHLDILVNNAAQTVRRPASFYAAWAALELEPRAEPRRSTSLVIVDGLSRFYERAIVARADDPGLIDHTRSDEEGLPLDLRRTNSWRLQAAAVSPAELLEVLAVNTIAPFLLTTGLRPLLEQSPRADRYVIHAAAVEGQFYAPMKTTRHPHTNMAKAALNMFTRTSSMEFARAGIFMTSVDTGWITNENPLARRARHGEHGFRLPIDAVDGAARLYDPIVRGAFGERFHGVLLKDYVPAAW